MSSEPRRVGYILKMFPRLSETFILNELLELERQGVELSLFSLLQPNDGRFHGRTADLKLTAEYYPGGKPENGWNALRELSGADARRFVDWEEAADFLERHRVPKQLDLLLRASLIAAHAKRDGVQHLHAHFATSATRMAAVVSMLTGLPFSFTAHAKDIFSDAVDKELLAALVKRAQFVVTVSDFNRRFMLDRLNGIDERKLVRLYNGIDLDFFSPVAKARTGPAHVVSVGRLVPKKGFDHLLRAIRLCKNAGLALRTTIVGDGPELDALRRLRGDLGLDGDVTLAGSLAHERVREILAEATLVALACVPGEDGDMDALPTVLLEALALDLPIVATRLAGIPEIVGDEAGRLVEPRDDAGMAAAIATIAERSGAVAPGAARARGERLFDLRTNVSTLRGLFAKSVGAGMPA